MARKTLTELEYRLLLKAAELEAERMAAAQRQAYETMQWIARQHDPSAHRVKQAGERVLEWESDSDEGGEQDPGAGAPTPTPTPRAS